MKVVGMNSMRSRRGTLGLVVVLGLLLPALSDAQLLAPLDGPAAELASEVVPAAGRHAVVVTIHRFGRYTIAAASEQGVALQLVGRMTGPGAIDGEPGVEDGRLDVFLDVGEYLVRTIGDDRAVGEVQLRVHPLEEANPVPAPQLVELKPIATELADGVQRSYWLEVASRDWVYLEAGGRALADLRLWQDGSWLVDAEPEVEIVDPVVGKPLRVCRIATQLEPGLYLVTASGGEPQAWAEDDGTFPLHLRLGIPRLGTADRRRYEVGPLGIDRWRVPGVASYLRLEVPEAVPAELRAGSWSDARPFMTPSSRAEIVKQSRLPVAELRVGARGGDHLVTVRAAAGQPYVFQHFRPDRRIELSSGTYWVSSVHSGDPADSVEATGLLVDWTRSDHVEPVRSQVPELSSTDGWTARCNLLEPLSVFFEVKDGGRYVIDSRGTDATFRFQPFMVSQPKGYQAPPFAPAGTSWDLDPGYWVLEAVPVNQGILDMAIRPDGMLAGVLDAVGLGADMDGQGFRPSVRFGQVTLVNNRRYTLYLNQQPGVVVGPVVRPIPLAVDTDPLPLALQPGESVAVPITLAERSRLEAMAEDGGLLELEVDGGRRSTSPDVSTGRHTVIVHHNGVGPALCSLGATPVRLLAATPLPPVPAATLADLPDFMVLEAEQPHHFDLVNGQRETFRVGAPADALYRLETTGLLATEGRLRSRVVTDLARADSGGTGRNFLLHQYLASGDYQLTVSPRGRSAGHLGLGLRRTDPRDGGELRDGLPARATLAAGESIRYRFTIAEEATYRLRTLALGPTPTCRFETGDGWPLVKPGGAADFEQVLEPGDYALTLLPAPVTGRRVTVLERVAEPVERRGHGPHELPLDEVVQHVWTEPKDDGERLPDIWIFRLEAGVEIRLELAPEMEGRLIREVGGDAQWIANVGGEGDPWHGELDRGSYRIEVVRSRPDNFATYTLAVRPAALLPGMEREVGLPAAIDVALPEDLVEITTLGDVDVAARLVDSDDRVVARIDDRPDDWNVLLTGRLPVGVSRLELEPVGARSGRTSVRIARRPEKRVAPLDVLGSLPVDLADEVLLVPLAAHSQGGVVVANLATNEAVGLALEARNAAGDWRVVGQRLGAGVRLEAPVAAADELRLRVWSVDRRGASATLTTGFAIPERISERKLRRGVRPSTSTGVGVAVLELDLQSPGVLRLASAPGAVRFSPLEGRLLEAVAGDVVVAPAGRSWLAVDVTDSGELRADRLVLSDEASVRLPLVCGEPATLDVAPPGRGLNLVVARAMTGQPVVSFDNGVDPTSRYRATVVAPHAALAVARNADAIRLELAGDGWLPEDVRATLQVVEPHPAGRLVWGVTDGTVADAITWMLPTESGELRLTLDRGLVAAVLDGDDVVSLHWGGDGPLAERTEVAGGARLVVASLEGRPASYRFELFSGGRTLRVAPGRPFHLESVASGRIAVEVDRCDVSGQVLVVDGADVATFLGDDGRVVRGHEIATGGMPGRLILDHAAAPVTVWFGPEEAPALGLWDGINRPPLEMVATPWRGEIALSRRSIAFDLAETRLVRVTTGGGAVLRFCAEGECKAWLATAAENRYLAAGPGRVTVDAQAAAVTTLEFGVGDLTTVGEGLGDERVVAAGEAHGFRFRVAEPGPVGVGVRADPDTVSCALLAADGSLLGDGVVQMHDLEPGDYLLLVSQPTDAGVSRIRPAVVGIERPSTGPPDDVVRRFLDLERSAQ